MQGKQPRQVRFGRPRPHEHHWTETGARRCRCVHGEEGWHCGTGVQSAQHGSKRRWRAIHRLCAELGVTLQSICETGKVQFGEEARAGKIRI